MAVAACVELGVELPWQTRRANLLVSGLSFNETMVGEVIQIGEVRLQITRQTDPCALMDKLHNGLKNALTPEWRGGVCCKVLQAGTVMIGASIIYMIENTL